MNVNTWKFEILHGQPKYVVYTIHIHHKLYNLFIY